MRDKWAKDQDFDDCVAEVTAKQGSRITGGKWTRPDIAFASYRTFPYAPGKHFEVIVFEVKPYDTVDITVVYEALGHRRAATRAFALLCIPEEKIAVLQPTLDEVCAEAKRFGIGVITAAEADNYDTWEELVEALRYDPDPARLNEFLAQQVSLGFREEVIKWHR